MEAELFFTDGETSRQADMMKLIVTFRNSAKTPRNGSLRSATLIRQCRNSRQGFTDYPSEMSQVERLRSVTESRKGRFTHSMPCPCHAHAVPLPCRAAKCLEYVFPIWFTQCGRVWFTLAMPCSDHAVLLKATAQHGHRQTACGLPARVRLLPATTRSSTKIVIRSIPILLTTIHTYDCKEW